MECIAILSEKYEGIACIQEKPLLNSVIVHSADLLMCSDILIVLIFAFYLIFDLIFTMRHCIFYISIHAF